MPDTTPRPKETAKTFTQNLIQVFVLRIARAQPLELKPGEPAREADREGRENDVERDRERELDAGQEKASNSIDRLS